jgi:hypothetical protein
MSCHHDDNFEIPPCLNDLHYSAVILIFPQRLYVKSADSQMYVNGLEPVQPLPSSTNTIIFLLRHFSSSSDTT